jgi:hypothetical protein
LASDHLCTTAEAFATLFFGQLTSPWVDRVRSLAGIGIIMAALLRWRRAPEAAAFLAAGTLATVAFMHAKYGIAPWHRSVLFVILMASLWIARGEGGARGTDLLPRGLVAMLLAVQALGGVWGAAKDRILPYSSGRDVAAALRAAGLDTAPLFALGRTGAETVVAYLGASSAFYGAGMREGSFIIWDQKRLSPVDPRAVTDLAAARGGALVLDCADTMPQGPPPDPRLREWGRFAAKTESCVVYDVAR